MHQRRGIGNLVLDTIIEQCRAWGADSLLVSWVPGRGSPERWYLARGFVPTGRIVDGEIEGRLPLV
jgi:diamine N-acetyltransferase